MNIDLTDREIELLMMCVGTNIETIKRRRDATEPMNTDLIEELFELETDLREAVNRQDDGWGDSEDPAATVFMVAEDDFIKRGLAAREHAKMNSHAQARRDFNMKREDKNLSKTQTHDVWDANDPKNW